ncbi:hypothetical protein NA57DRAFT_72905 [Rhizodiscina lignyota]|uniref:WIBG Mago-binding domain-containing protein n=1 Tax=Rhizodiscina lignyota TaxID=1504668 RepID=A0A9P4IN36_9PEZI|nr:hypothetical protein NA57DRAFT_72905 [Rhizodiscina lignyota]
MSSNDAPTNVSKAGISTSASGERVIASSTRADGTVRKERRVRPGYRPPEDVEVYKNRTAEAWKNRGSAGVPGAEKVDTEEKKSSASSKNAKKREARKKAAANVAESQKDNLDKGGSVNEAKPAEPAASVENKEATIESEKAEVDPEAEKEKEARKLAKKLRQARELKDKKEKGDALLPEQLEKVIRINELIRQLEILGYDANGEKKATNDTG